MMNPIKSDRRYTITLEHTGHPKPHHVVRFCDEFVGSSQFLSSAVAKAVGHNAIRNGAEVVTEVTA